jgi:ketosteroid isomerase-like protein
MTGLLFRPDPAQAATGSLRALHHTILESRFGGRSRRALSQATPEFLGIAADGGWLDRDGLEASITKAAADTLIGYETPLIRMTRDAALIHGVAHVLDAARAPQKLRYTEVYLNQPDGWRLAATQDTPLAAGVTPDMIQGRRHEAPGWNRPGPQGTEADVLLQLNEAYVDSFRRADVGWYAVHLAADYVVTFGDGSFHDRDDALSDFAIPYYADRIADFPVAQVCLRRIGDLALIRAENDYRLKDGRRGINRYIDIWQMQSGGWRCLSAHITIHRAPA